jgi:hypothetical protein
MDCWTARPASLSASRYVPSWTRVTCMGVFLYEWCPMSFHTRSVKSGFVYTCFVCQEAPAGAQCLTLTGTFRCSARRCCIPPAGKSSSSKLINRNHGFSSLTMGITEVLLCCVCQPGCSRAPQHLCAKLPLPTPALVNSCHPLINSPLT